MAKSLEISTSKQVFRLNNFDLIRLFAAFQVAIHHSVSHLGVDLNEYFLKLTALLPGVPIFFFISGFLISRSYENNSNLRVYTLNRIKRIYPALFLCTFLSVFSVYLTGYMANHNVSVVDEVLWIFGQISFMQFYNPEFMRQFGTGVLNGSLWTIAVELQFYIILPLFYYVFLRNKTLIQKNVLVLLFILVFLVLHLIHKKLTLTYTDEFSLKLLGVSFIPWVYMFFLGVIFQINFEKIHKLTEGKCLYLLVLYLVLSGCFSGYYGWDMGNSINPLLYLLLALSVFSLSYSLPSSSKKILGGNDISYGVYIYHIPIINIFLYYGFVAEIQYLILAIIGTLLLAMISWRLVEKPVLNTKVFSINKG
jgi:peptidoglycan/LPS O-acetylase OafA/YrhL